MKPQLAVIGLRGFPGVQGGVERHCSQIIPRIGLTARVYRRKPYISDTERENYDSIEFVDLPSTRIKGFEAAFHTFLCVLHLWAHPAEVVNIHNIGPGILTPLLRLRGMKVVLTYHSANYLHSKWGRIARGILRLGEKLSLRYANKVIFVDRSRLEEASAQVRAKAVWIPNIAEKTIPTENNDFITSLGGEPGKYILAVGRITPEKGFDTLITAAQQLPDDYKIIIAGDCDHGTSYAKQLKRLDTAGKVIFAGFADGEKLRQLYTHAALFVLPSRHEGMSMALLEAMTYGLPVCVSDIPANRLPQLSDADFFPVDDTDTLADFIKNYLAGAPMQLRSYDLSAYSADAVISATRAVYSPFL